MLFNTFENNFAMGISLHVFLYTDELKICAKVNSIRDCYMLQYKIDLIVESARINRMRLNTMMAAIISHGLKTLAFKYNYILQQSAITRFDDFMDLGV